MKKLNVIENLVCVKDIYMFLNILILNQLIVKNKDANV